jgi:hypothetical protein
MPVTKTGLLSIFPGTSTPTLKAISFETELSIFHNFPSVCFIAPVCEESLPTPLQPLQLF